MVGETMKLALPISALRLFGISLVLVLAACGGIEPRDGPGRITKATKAPPAVPKNEPLSKYGNPKSYEVFGKRYYPLKTSDGFREQGIASWYGKKFHGRKTSSGEIYDMYKMTAAHKHLPLPTYVTVRNTKTGQSIVVRVNDRGPFHGNRIIDLSYAAASKLGIANSGTGFVEVTAMNAGSNRSLMVNNGLDRQVVNTPPEIVLDKPPEQELKSQVISPVVSTATPAQSSAARDNVSDKANQGSNIYLQIGAFSERGNAQIALKKVIQHMPGARIQEAQNAGNPVYRVQVGPIIDVQNADIYVERLLALGFADHHFISP
jgi:rare lipoprotein A